MARFTIYSPAGVALYEGTPTFTGQYMKPGFLEFREVALPALVDLVPGCYVDYTRTGHRYRIYTAPQLKKQARTNTYGGAFVYQSVQLYDASKMLEYCPFRDLVLGDNRIHFSTQPSISTFEGCDGLARRFEACLRDQYDVNGVQSWAVRIADAYENPDLHDLMLEPRDFTVSGVNILECLDKIYEIWPGVGWLYTVENSVDTIVIGGVGTNSGTYAYGKGNGLTSLTRTAANAEEIANRIFAYGSSRNMLPRWYNSQNIKDAESVDIQNLMIPVSSWGLTDNLPDAAKAFVEDAASILKNGLRPATVYFDGNGEYPEIYPSIRETTIGMVRTAIGDPTAKNYPSTTVYTNPSQRIDQVISAPASFDSGLAGNVPGKANVEMGDTPFSANSSFLMPAGITYYPFYHYQGTWTPETAGLQTIAWKLELSGQVQLDGIEKVTVSVQVKDPSYHGPVILSNGYDLTPDGSGIVILSGKEMVAEKVSVSAVSYIVNVDIAVYMAEQATDKTGTYTAVGNVGFALQNYRKKFFNISIRQVGFDINEQSALGNGKTIAMRTGKCAGRSFAINSVQYDSTNDCWNLECWRTEDESLSQWFPNTDYPVRGLENAGQSNEYPGDEFVLLDIAMPAIYVQMAEQKLLTAAQELLADTAVERWQYSPEIDAKFMVENNRTINAGEYLLLSDADIIGQSAESVLVDTVTINEGESAIPTYKVTLRDRKKKTWTESQSPEQSSGRPVGSIQTQQDTPYVDLSGYVKQDEFNDLADRVTALEGESFFMLDTDGNVTLKAAYNNLWVPGWLAAGGIGSGSGGGGGVDLDRVWQSLTNNTDKPNVEINIAHIPNITTAKITDLETWIASKGYAITSSLPTEQTVAGWGFTKNAGTVTSVTLNSGDGIAVTNSGVAIISSGSRTISISSTYRTRINNGNTAYGWGNHAEAGYLTSASLSGYATQAWVQEQGYLTQETDPTVPSWAKASSKPSYSLSEISGTGDLQAIEALSGTGLLKRTGANAWSLDTTTYLASGTTLDDIADGSTRKLSNYLPLSGGTMTGAITMSSANIYPSASHTCNLGASAAFFTGVYGDTVHAHALELYSSGSVQAFRLQGGIENPGATNEVYYALLTLHQGTGEGLYITKDTMFGMGSAKDLGKSYARWKGVYAASADLTGNLDLGGVLRVNSFNTIDQSNASMSLFNFGARATKSFNAYGLGANFRACDSNGNQVNILAINATKIQAGSDLIPNYTEGLNLGGSSANTRWATIYGVDANLSGDLSLSSSSHIDIGPVRIVYDSASDAIHITTNDATNHPTIGIYADGFVAAGGVGQTS